MNIVITGATGLVGSTLNTHLNKTHHVNIFSRKRKKDCVYWDPINGILDRDVLEKADVVIHLAGASIFHRWSKSYKSLIRSSRINTTRFLVDSIASLHNKPKLFISASAIGYYGNNQMEDSKDESSLRGSGFLADVCEAWEDESKALIGHGIRVVQLRFGVVLANDGGALSKMLPIFKMGIGGMLGSGKQPMSWISIKEISPIIDFIIENQSIFGPVNVVSPEATTNSSFTKALCTTLHRPVFIPVPSFFIKILMGQMGNDLLLNGVNVFPNILVKHGYEFRYPHLKGALENLLT